MEAIKITNSLYQVENSTSSTDSFLFSCLSDHQANELKKYVEVVKLKKGQHIYQKGEKAMYIFFIEKGSVKIYGSSNTGKEVIKNILHPQNIIGEESFSGMDKRLDSAKAMDPEVELLRIHVEDLKGLTQRYWELNEKFIGLLTQKLQRSQQRVKGLIVDDARKRIIDFLKYNAQHKGKKIGFELLIKHSMTQQDIANYTGTSRQTVTSILNDLRKTNKIYFKRNSILIRDIANLS